MASVQEPRKTFGEKFAKVFGSFRKRKSETNKSSKEDILEIKKDSDFATPAPSLKKSSNEDISDLKSDSDLATQISSLKICSEEDSSEMKNYSDLTTPASSSKMCSEDNSMEIQNDSHLTTPAPSSKICTEEDSSETKNLSDLTNTYSLTKICSEEDSSEAKIDSDLFTSDLSTKKCSKEDSSETKHHSDLATACSSSKVCSKEDSFGTKSEYSDFTTFGKASNMVKRATEEDKKRNYEVAFRLYEHAVEYLLHAMKYEYYSDQTKETTREKCAQYLERAEKIKKYLRDKQKSKRPGGETSDEDSDEEDSDEEDEEIFEQIRDTIEYEGPYVKWSDVVGLEKEKEALKEAVILPYEFPHLFSEERKSWKRILLFGPSGAGKSLLAKAVATEARHSNFLSVSQSHLLCENEKFVRNLFKLARRRNPCIIFIDGIDILCLSSKEQESASIVGMKAEFLEQMKDDTDGVMILGATNKPWKLDADILRRFEKKIYIPLPDEIDRKEIFKINIGDIPNCLNEEDLKLIAKHTDGFSRADIVVLVHDAQLLILKIVESATHFAKIRWPSGFDTVDYYFSPCSPRRHGAIEMSWLDVPSEKLLDPELTMRLAMYSLNNSKRTVDDTDLWQFTRFIESEVMFLQQGI